MKSKSSPIGVNGIEKIGEQNRGVDVDDVNRLERHGHREFGRSADIEQ